MKTIVTYLVAVFALSKLALVYFGSTEEISALGLVLSFAAYYIASILALSVRAAFKEGVQYIFFIALGILVFFGVDAYMEYTKGIEISEALIGEYDALLMLLALILAYLTASFVNEKIWNPLVAFFREKFGKEEEENAKETQGQDNQGNKKDQAATAGQQSDT